jgi:ABC-type multidrug transport system ATPase subunit
VSAEKRRSLNLTNITVQRGRRVVLEDVSVSLGSGEIIAIVGPNGAGKTTLLEAVLGLVPLARGALRIDHQAIQSFADRARSFTHMAAEAEPALEMSVDRWVTLIRSACDPRWSAFLELRLGLEALRGAVVGRLSRGERKRLLLFEALSSNKPFLLLDEPTGVFDPLQLCELVEVFRAAAARGCGMLLTLHQMSDAEALATRILILSGGRSIALGTLDELRTQARLDSHGSLHDVFLALLRKEHEHART